MSKKVYTSEVKWLVVKEKLSGTSTTKEIMEKYGIKNRSQISTWMRWYRNNEIYRFDQPIGKQYSYGLGPDGQSEADIINRKMAHLEMENKILKKFIAIAKELEKK